MNCDIHHRVLKLRDVALGLKKTVQVNSALAAASYDCAMDSLLALHSECSQASSLSKDKNVARFLGKYTSVVDAVKELQLTVDDFEKKSVIGRGHFGEVQLVREKSTGDTYAMKIMQKSHILQQADAAFFSEERDIMAWANSSWLTSLHYAFQDKSCLYLVMDFHPGGDLLTVMERKEGGMSEMEARFYLSEIAAGLHDLHQLGFVHRDVKPENVLITRSGHIKLVDFGSAARLGDDGRVVESRLPVGTPEYIAPEVLTSLDKSANYGVCCDWWSLGIIAYELLYESTPFEDDSTSKMYGNIMSFKTKLSFPSEPTTSGEVKGLIKSLLTEHNERLSFEELKKHKFFCDVVWDHLISVVPPYIPVVSSVDDTSNFDIFDSEKDSLRNMDLSSKDHRNFSGKNLPFVGFTYTRYDDPSHNEQNGSFSSSITEVDHDGVKELQWSLGRVQKELLEMKERKTSLERECVIYQSQLDDFHRKLEIEKSERRQSDSKALRLLEEVREHGRVVKELREQEASATQGNLKAVIEQLEQERATESKRSRRLKEELKKSQTEREQALKKLVEMKSKLTEVKETNRKDVTALQNKLAKVTKDSLSKTSEMQDRLLEAQERCVVVSKKLQETEEARMKADYKIKQMQLQAQTTSVAAEDPAELKSQLESLQLAHDELVKELEVLLATTRNRNKELSNQLETANKRNHELESNEMKLTNELQALKLKVDNFHLLKADYEKIGEKLFSKTQEVQQQTQIISDLKSAQKRMEAEMAELEKLKDASTHTKENLQTTHAVELVKQEAEVSRLEAQLVTTETAKKEIESQLGEAKKRSSEEEQRHREEIKSLQSQLSEATNIAIQQGEKLREVRRIKRELDQENMDLKTALRKAERESSSLEKKYTSVCEELKALQAAKEKLTTLERDMKSLYSENKDLEHKVKMKEHEKEEVMLSKRGLESTISSIKKELEAQELNTAMLQRTIKSLEDELMDARSVSEETKAHETQWQSVKEMLTGDLECAESKLDDAYSTIEKEKGARLSAELQLKNVTESLEKTVLAHSEEVQEIQEQLNTQRQLASKYSDKVSELEKELRLKQLSHKEAQKNLDLEKALSSKLYDDMHLLKREHGKMKAAHMKLLGEVQERELQLAQATEAQEKMLEQQRSASLDRTKLEVTIDQQAKLIDYLHGPSASQSSTKKKKGFKFGRKSRDPAKEIAEWNKLRGILRKPGKGSVAKGSSSNVSLVSFQTPKSTSTSSLEQQNLMNSSTPFITSTIASSSSATTAPPPPLRDHLGSSPTLSSFASQIMPTTMSANESSEIAESANGAISHGDESGQDDVISDDKTYVSGTTPVKDKPSPSKVRPAKRGVVVGRKRKAKASSSDEGGTISPGKKLPTMQHNIPHKFHLKTSGLHKTQMCSACKELIKPLQKLSKCSYCNVTCHPQCINTLPNNCGLPSQLAEQVEPPPAKKQSQDNSSRGTEKSQNKKRSNKKNQREETGGGSIGAGKEKEIDLTDDSGSGGGVVVVNSKKGATIYTGQFDPDKVIRNEKVTVIRGSMKTVGWLLLTEDSLCHFDRDPRGLTRKPIHSFNFDASGCVFLILPNIASGQTRSSQSPGKHTELAFGIEKHSMSGVEQTIFYAETVKSKIDWVEDIGKVLSSFSQRTSSPRDLARGDVMSPPRSQAGRELKAVAITPVTSSVNSTSPARLKRKAATSGSPRRAKRTKK